MGINDILSVYSGFNVGTVKSSNISQTNSTAKPQSTFQILDTLELSGQTEDTSTYPTYNTREEFISATNQKNNVSSNEYENIKSNLTNIANGESVEGTSGGSGGGGGDSEESETTTEIVRNSDGSVYQVTTTTDSEGNETTTTTIICGPKNNPMGGIGAKSTVTNQVSAAPAINEDDISLFFGA